MIRYSQSIRFASHEVEEFRHVGLDLSTATSDAHVAQALRAWAQLIALERPDLLVKIAPAMADAKGRTLPATLSAVASEPLERADAPAEGVDRL